VSEVVKIELTDIMSDMMRIKVRNGKGAKDRYTILSELCLKYLKKYYQRYRPEKYLFPGRFPDTSMSVDFAQRTFYKAKKKAGIMKQGGIHTLRHSFATHALETGTGIFQVQKFLGHSSLQTTLQYVHLCEEKVIARSPLDVYVENKNNC